MTPRHPGGDVTRVNTLMMNAGITASALAEHGAGVAPRTIVIWVRGRQFMLRVARRLAPLARRHRRSAGRRILSSRDARGGCSADGVVHKRDGCLHFLAVRGFFGQHTSPKLFPASFRRYIGFSLPHERAQRALLVARGVPSMSSAPAGCYGRRIQQGRCS
jgi:hypothetical protein